jgi:hypothetical protein
MSSTSIVEAITAQTLLLAELRDLQKECRDLLKAILEKDEGKKK